jgi:hypothetical protein
MAIEQRAQVFVQHLRKPLRGVHRDFFYNFFPAQ